jgi:hypothetical protein
LSWEHDHSIAAAGTLSTASGLDQPPAVTGEDGKAVLEIMMAAYASAGAGKKLPLPFATDAKRPIDLWKKV